MNDQQVNQELLLKTIETLNKKLSDANLDNAVLQSQIELLSAQMEQMGQIIQQMQEREQPVEKEPILGEDGQPLPAEIPVEE